MTSRVRRGRLLLALGGAGATFLLTLIACGPGFLDGISGGNGAVGGPGDGSGGDGGKSDAFVCTPAVPPPAPSENPSGTDITLQFAMERIHVGADSPNAGIAPPVGLNLDGVCTCPGVSSCALPAGTRGCDNSTDIGGRDNALAGFFTQLLTNIPIFEPTFASDRIAQGSFNILIGLSGYNQQKDDSSVNVAVRLSQDFDTPAADGGRRPVFDGNDVWTVDPDSVSGMDSAIGRDCRAADAGAICIPRFATGNAYVRDGVLVARFDNYDVLPLVIRTGLGRLEFELADATLVANLSNASGGPNTWRLEGEFTGRWSAKSVLKTMGNLENPIGGGYLCNSGQTYADTKKGVCATLDIAGKRDDDNKNAPCNAVSSAIRFTASKAIVGHIMRKDPVDAPCGAFEDDCQ